MTLKVGAATKQDTDAWTKNTSILITVAQVIGNLCSRLLLRASELISDRCSLLARHDML